MFQGERQDVFKYRERTLVFKMSRENNFFFYFIQFVFKAISLFEHFQHAVISWKGAQQELYVKL